MRELASDVTIPRDALGRRLPAGSVGVPSPPEVERTASETLNLAAQLLREGRPFAAHEVFEGRWKNCPDAERDLWQGLAQLAVGFTHLGRGNTPGAERLFERATGHLKAYSDELSASSNDSNTKPSQS